MEKGARRIMRGEYSREKWIHGRRKRGRPVEGGLVGVWFASLVYGILVMITSHNIGGKVVYALLLAFIAPFIAGEAWRRRGSQRIILTLSYALFYMPALYGLPLWKTLLLAGYALVLVLGTYRPGLGMIVSGGSLLALTGGLVAYTATGCLLCALLPSFYSVSSVATAGLRVTGTREALLYSVSGVIMISLFSLILLKYNIIASILLLADSLTRFLAVYLGFTHNLSIRTYGFLEAIHSPLILGILAYLIA